MNSLLSFENQQVEVLEVNGTIYFNPYHVGKCLDLTDSAVRKAVSTMNENQAIKLTQSIVNSSNIRKLHSTGELFLTESGVYKLIFKSRKPNAEKFADWVTDEVLPTIRKTGKYETNPQQQSLTRKTYKGKLVMTINDLSCITGVHRSTIRNVVKLQDHKLLKYREMMEYKKENKETLHGSKSLIIFGKDTALYVLSYFQYDDLKSTILNYFKEEPKKELPKPKDEPQKPVTYGEVELALKILSLMPESDFKTKACQSLLYDVMGKGIFQNVDFLMSVDKLIENIQSLTKDERIEEIESKKMKAFLASLSKRGCFLLKRELNRVVLSE